jgi:hypothetical protein
LCLGRIPTPEPLYASACFVTRTFASGGSLRTTSSAVIIFVSEAIDRTLYGCRAHNTLPVWTSKSSPAVGGSLKCMATRSGGETRCLA